jgi:hypothetical protein
VDEGADKVIIEEFAWERLDHTAADFRYDNRALLVATGLLDAELPSGDLLDTWVAGHDFLHQGAAMLTALSRVGSDMTTVATAMLWRLVDGRGGAWTEPATRAPNTIRLAEERRIAAGALPPVGLIAAIRR